MTVSALTYTDLANYLRIDSDDLDATEIAILTGFLSSAKASTVSYTGLTEAQLSTHEDVAIAVLCLAGDMYTNRDMYTNLKGTGTASVNKTVQSILDRYCVNLIPGEVDIYNEDTEDDEDSEEDA